MDYTHHIKARKKGEKVWRFMEPRGGMNRLRIHAALLTEERANTLMERLPIDNPEYEFKIIPIQK